MGSDFCPKIPGLGPKTIPKLIQDFGNIESVLLHLDQAKFEIPLNFIAYKKARKLFLFPPVIPAAQVRINWLNPDEDELIQFLNAAGMSSKTVEQHIKKLKKALEVCRSWANPIKLFMLSDKFTSFS